MPFMCANWISVRIKPFDEPLKKTRPGAIPKDFQYTKDANQAVYACRRSDTKKKIKREKRKTLIHPLSIRWRAKDRQPTKGAVVSTDTSCLARQAIAPRSRRRLPRRRRCAAGI